MRQVSPVVTILNAKGATGTGVKMDVQDFKYLVMSFATASSGNLTVKFQGSISETAPDFSSAQSSTNVWDYIDVTDLQSFASVDGDTGVAVTGTDDVRQFQASTNGLKWLCATVTARSAGNVTVTARGFSN